MDGIDWVFQLHNKLTALYPGLNPVQCRQLFQ